ncbi:MAG: hypothetical protein AAGA64_08715 [Bacteroidota bacterium]
MKSHQRNVHALTSLSVKEIAASITTVSKSRSLINETLFTDHSISLSEITSNTNLTRDRYWKRKNNVESWSLDEIEEVSTLILKKQVYKPADKAFFKELKKCIRTMRLFLDNLVTYLTIQDISTDNLLREIPLTKDKYYYRRNNPKSWKFSELQELLTYVESKV